MLGTPPRILLVAAMQNPLGQAWAEGLSRSGCRVAVADWWSSRATDGLHVGSEADIEGIRFDGPLGPSDKQHLELLLDGEPEVVVAWWGSPAFAFLEPVRSAYPDARYVLCIDTFPNASVLVTEIREVLRYRRMASAFDAFIHYSAAMQRLFLRRVPAARSQQHVVMPEAFPRRAFDIDEVNRTKQGEPWHPRVVFIGRGDHLWTRDPRMRKDAIGPLLAQLTSTGVEVFVPSGSDTRGMVGLNEYPLMPSDALFDGRFGTFLSGFDAQLCLYNEWNGTARRRSSTGLSTRFAAGMTGCAPLMVTETTTFLVEEHWQERPFGASFRDADRLAALLHDRELLCELRTNMRNRRLDYTFESLSEPVIALLAHLAHGG